VRPWLLWAVIVLLSPWPHWTVTFLLRMIGNNPNSIVALDLFGWNCLISSSCFLDPYFHIYFIFQITCTHYAHSLVEKYMNNEFLGTYIKWPWNCQIPISCNVSLGFSVFIDIFIIKSCRTRAAPLSIYKDSNANGETCPPQPDPSHSWLKLGGRAERNKENNAIPAKWKSFKVLIFA